MVAEDARVEKERVDGNAELGLPAQGQVVHRLPIDEERRHAELAVGLHDGINAPVKVVAVGNLQSVASTERLHLPLDLLGEDRVVRVEELDQRAPRGGESTVAARRLSEVGVMEVPIARVAIHEASRHLAGVVRGAVVDDQAFPLLMGLRGHAGEGLAEVSRMVEARDNHRDEWAPLGHERVSWSRGRIAQARSRAWRLRLSAGQARASSASPPAAIASTVTMPKCSKLSSTFLARIGRPPE